MLDMDDITEREARRHVERLMLRFRLGGYVLLRSSSDGWHVVFDRRTNWRNVLRVAFACPPCRKRHKGRLSWAELQAIKGYATLRVGNKGRKHAPRIVEIRGNRKGQVAEFLAFYRRFRNL